MLSKFSETTLVCPVMILFMACCFLIIGCKNQKKRAGGTPLVEYAESTSCFSKSEREQIVTAIINVDYVTQNHMHPQVIKGKMTAKILVNSFVTVDLNVRISQMPVNFVDSVNLTEDTYRIKILKRNCVQKQITFLVTNPFDGQWSARGEVRHDGNRWIADVTSGGIAD